MDYHFRIYFSTKNKQYIDEIIKKFRIDGISVNGESSVRCNEQEALLLKECERRGFIQIRSLKQKS